jgi:hypothetical protein
MPQCAEVWSVVLQTRMYCRTGITVGERVCGWRRPWPATCSFSSNRRHVECSDFAAIGPGNIRAGRAPCPWIAGMRRGGRAGGGAAQGNRTPLCINVILRAADDLRPLPSLPSCRPVIRNVRTAQYLSGSRARRPGVTRWRPAAAKRVGGEPAGRCASGRPFRTARTCSRMACTRCAASEPSMLNGPR